MDWSGSTVDLTLGAPDLYTIRTAAKEERALRSQCIRRSQSAALLTLPLTHCLISSVSHTPGYPAPTTVASAIAALHLYLLLWCYIDFPTSAIEQFLSARPPLPSSDVILALKLINPKADNIYLYYCLCQISTSGSYTTNNITKGGLKGSSRRVYGSHGGSRKGSSRSSSKCSSKCNSKCSSKRSSKCRTEAPSGEPGGLGEPVVTEPDDDESESYDKGAYAAFKEAIEAEDYKAYIEAL